MRTLYGINPVREFLRAGGEGLAELWLLEGHGQRERRLTELEQLAKQANAKIRSAPRPKLDQLAGGTNHQGVVAVVSDYRYRHLDDLLEAAERSGRKPLLLILDGIEDPQNLGSIIRSGHAMGAHGVIIGKDRASPVTPAVAKASAGAIEHCPVARVTNISQTIDRLKDKNIWSVALAADAAPPISSIDLAGPSAIVIGSEGDGIRRLVRKNCDSEAHIPMAGRVDSLNAAASAAICLYEAGRQRGTKPTVPKSGGAK